MQKYNEVRDNLETGDLVLFSGNNPISSLIKLMTRSKWSHVGMVYKLLGDVFIWESTSMSNVPDNEGNYINGVQLTLLSNRIQKYDGNVTIQRLLFDREEKTLKQLAAFRNLVKSTPYEESIAELFKSAYDTPITRIGELFNFRDNEEDLSSLFCSELVAKALQVIDVLNNETPANEYVPKDFSASSLEFALTNGARIGATISIK